MDAYTDFAGCYDLFMDNVPYDSWSNNLINYFKQYNIQSNSIICELGCGTGQITRRLAKAGYDMIGIDLSYEMLDIARETSEESILYLCQDMREFELFGTVAAIVSICDSINYLRSTEELLKVCILANNYLDPKGLFIFDINSSYKYSHILASNTFAENRDEGSFIWENEYDSINRDNYYNMTFYMMNDEGTFDRFEESHIQHSFSIDEVTECINKSGLKLLSILDAETLKAPEDTTERILFIAQEITKELD